MAAESGSASPLLPPTEPVARVATRTSLSLDDVVVDPDLQVRAELDEDLVQQYVDALEAGARFPPIVVFEHSGANCVADGFHRVAAYRRAGRAGIEADVYPGDRQHALWFALGANRAHGQRLGRDDKRRAIELAYREWPDLSQRAIVGHVGCTQPYVAKIRAQLITGYQLPDSVVGIDGRRRPATRPAPSSAAAAVADAGGTELASSSPAPSADPVSSSPSGSDRSSSSAVSGSDRFSPPLVAAPAACLQASSAIKSSRLPDGDSPRSAPPSDRDVDSVSSDVSSDRPVSSRVTAEQSARERSNRIVSVVVYDAKNLILQADLVDFSLLDPAEVAGWIAGLEEARSNLARWIRRLRQEVPDAPGPA